MSTLEVRNYIIAATVGGFLGLQVFAIGYSLVDAINFSFMDVYSFKLPLLKATPEDRDLIMRKAEKLLAEGSSLAYQKALWDHGLDGLGAGAGIGVLSVLSTREIRRYINRKLNSIESKCDSEQ
jgi:hypothetical protein